jgi:hypothetical protein
MYIEHITGPIIIASSILFGNRSDEVSGKGVLQ